MQTWTLVTGGAKGLGAAICSTLAAEGHSIAVHFNRSQHEAEEVAESCRFFGVHAEIVQGNFATTEGTEAFLARYLARFGETKFLVNNVGNFLAKSALATTSAEWEAILQSNVQTPFMLMTRLADSLKRHQGAIVNIGIAGLQTLRADTYCTAYTSAKLSLWMLTKSLARELAPFQVRVNMVSPGYLETSVALPQDPHLLPMKRLVRLREVSRAIAFLLHPESCSITGQNIEIAGAVRL